MSGMIVKRCCHCQQEKSVAQFFRSKVVKDGYRSRCKECEKGRPVMPRDNWKRQTQKKCAGCKELKSIDYFYLCNGRPNSHCKICHNKMTLKNYQERTDLQRTQYNRNRREHPDISQRRRNELLRRYGLTEEAFRIQFEAQKGRCAICREEMTRPCIDHCHDRGHPRGLLCTQCNTGIGNFCENTASLRAAIAYIESGGIW